MNGEQALEFAREAVTTMLIVSTPIMFVALAVGLIIALFQALTSIQEMTLTFVPKILIVFVALLLLLPFMADRMQTFTEGVADRIIAIGSE
ncbi:MAG: flagellar biosynthesis protein FliQ [Alphaproteobacteria bacterium]